MPPLRRPFRYDPATRARQAPAAVLPRGAVDDEARLGLRKAQVECLTTLDGGDMDAARWLAATLAQTAAPTGDVDYINKLFAEVERLKPSDLSNFTKKYMLDKNRTTVTLVSKLQRVAGGTR